MHVLSAATRETGNGSGAQLPRSVLICATVAVVFSTVLSVWTIILQLRNYRKMGLQRWVVRILVMVPVYAIASCVSLYSLDFAFFIDLVRDIYEAFCIYCFFQLILEYLGGERSLIILLHGREPTPHLFPLTNILPPLDISDPYTFLTLKRGIFQYVQIKPILAIVEAILKLTETFSDGELGNNGYTYVSVVYNISVTIALYCLAMFWVCVNDDLKPYRPVPKFLCVKGIVFFTFWQSFAISILVSIGFLKSNRISSEHLSLAIKDTLICFEMPLFAIMHLYAFSHKDYITSYLYVGRLPFRYALKDSILGFKDIFNDSLTTFKGTGFSYRTFEPAEGGLHRGLGRQRRIRAGLRYTNGGEGKYWLSMPGDTMNEAYGRRKYHITDLTDARDDVKKLIDVAKHPVQNLREALEGNERYRNSFAPITPEQAATVIHDARGTAYPTPATKKHKQPRWRDYGALNTTQVEEDDDSDDDYESDATSLEFGSPREEVEELFKDAKVMEFGDYNYPCVDASKEAARRLMMRDEEAFLRGERPHHSEPSYDPNHKGKSREEAHKTLLQKNLELIKQNAKRKKKPKPPPKLPEGCIDMLIEDSDAEQEEASRERRKGEPNMGRRKKIFRRAWDGPWPPSTDDDSDAEQVATQNGSKIAVVSSDRERATVDKDDELSKEAAVVLEQSPSNATRHDPPAFAEVGDLQSGAPLDSEDRETVARMDHEEDNPWS